MRFKKGTPKSCWDSGRKLNHSLARLNIGPIVHVTKHGEKCVFGTYEMHKYIKNLFKKGIINASNNRRKITN